MLFNSLSFLIFLPIVVLIYFVIPDRVKHLWLLAASYYFYMCWNAAYALLILFSLIAPAMLGVTGIFWAAPIADVFAMAVTAVVMLKLWRGLGRQAPATSACLPTDASTKCAIRS